MSSARARVFFALWPDAHARNLLGQAAQRMQVALQGRRTRDDSMHLTLAFVGAVGVERLPELAAPPLQGLQSFTLTLDRCGCWPHNGIGWMAPSVVPAPMQAMVAGLQAWLRGAGFELEVRPWRPHVTLVRKAQCVPLAACTAPITWHARDFVLVHSLRESDGPRYRIIGRWLLSA